MSDQPAQQALIPMSVEDLIRAGDTLARLQHELEMLKEHHAEIRKELRKEQKLHMESIEARIRSVADTIRTRGH